MAAYLDFADYVPMWRWRFLSSPSSTIHENSTFNCVVGLTDEFGTEIKHDIVEQILGKGINVRCEIHQILSSDEQNENSINCKRNEQLTFLLGQRSVVTSLESSKTSPRCRWVFRPKFAGENSDLNHVEIMVKGECSNGEEFDPIKVFPIYSSPITIIKNQEITRDVPSLHHFRQFHLSKESKESKESIIDVKIREEFGANLGAHVWNSGVVLAQWLFENLDDYRQIQPQQSSSSSSPSPSTTTCSHPSSSSSPLAPQLPLLPSLSSSNPQRRELKILELGSGCGLTGIVVAKCLSQPNDEICLTDLSQNLPLIHQNLELNGIHSLENKPLSNLKVKSLNWDYFLTPFDQTENIFRDKNHIQNGAGSFDMIIAADILYNEAHFQCLLNVFETFLIKPCTSLSNNEQVKEKDKQHILLPSPQVVIALSHRNHGPVVSESLLRSINTPDTHSFFIQAKQRNWFVKSRHFQANIEILEMSR